MSTQSSPTSFEAWIGHELVDDDEEKVGKIDDVYFDTETDQPEWVTVTTGLFGSKRSFVPTQGASNAGDRLQVRYSKDQIKDAPRIDPDSELSVEEEQELYRHYGLRSGGDAGAADRQRGRQDEESVDAEKGTGEGSMVRSEEELAVGTRTKEAGRVRLRKHVVTEMVTKTVPVQKEVVSIEREAIRPSDAGTAGGDIAEDEQEIVLHEEEAVAEKRVVAKERVSLAKDVQTEQQEVNAEVRKEQVDVDDSSKGRRRSK